MNFARFSFALYCAASLAIRLDAAEPAPALSASELANHLNAATDTGSSYVRLRMEIKGSGGKSAYQVQIKERHNKSGAEMVYQVLWPKEHKGEAILLRRNGNRPSGGTAFIPPDTMKQIDSADLRAPVFGSDLTYEDIIDNFYAWDQQAIAGNEKVDGVDCTILESKPGKSGRSSYGSVKSWVDTRRMVPLKIEKYSGSGKLACRIETLKVFVDQGRHIPANFTVSGRGDSVTELDGSKIKHDINFSDRDFSPEGLKEVAIPRGAPE